MDKQLAGFIFLLLGLAALFGVWMLAISGRSKTVDGGASAETHPETRAEPPQSRNAMREYSLTPPAPTQRSAGSAVRVQADHLNENASSREIPMIIADEDDDLASTHLEIAHQFFQLSDFEGAAEMAKLVMDNANASAAQVATAQKIQTECA